MTKFKLRIILLACVIVLGVIIRYGQDKTYKSSFKDIEIYGIIDSMRRVAEDKDAKHFYIKGKWQNDINSYTEGLSSAILRDSISKKLNTDTIELFRVRNGVYIRIYPN